MNSKTANPVARAVILAAGRGSRLGALTEDLPKCLVRYHGIPLIERAVEALRSAGISDIGITSGYRAEKLMEYKLRHFSNPGWETSGIFCSCMCANEWLREGVTLIVYGDIFFSARDVKRITSTSGDVLVAYDPHGVDLWRKRFANPLQDLETFRISRDSKILEIGGKPTRIEEVQGQYVGMICVSARGWSLLKNAWRGFQDEQARWMDMTTLLQALVSTSITVTGVPVEAAWGEIDSVEDLHLYEALYPPPTPLLSLSGA